MRKKNPDQNGDRGVAVLANRRSLRSANLLSHVITLPGGGGHSNISVVHMKQKTEKGKKGLFFETEHDSQE